MAITTAQIRGARGILGWSQQDLAQRTGISATSIGSIENNQTTPRESTIQTIRKTLENAGIEFIGLDGVRKRRDDVRIYTGKEGFIEFYNDIYASVRDKPSEILVSNVDERLFVKVLGDFAKVHVDRIEKLKNVNYKILIKEGDNYTPGAGYAEYKWIPQELFSSVPFYVYGQKLAIMIFENEPSIIVLQYPTAADAYRIQFYDMWNRAKGITESTAVTTL
jgi:transcriptional regulator with XRE-family HTH domain